jgi:N-acetylglutamate synthase
LRFDRADIESLERATLQAVAPEQVHELPGWLLPMDSGTVGRAHSAVPLSHGPCDPVQVDQVLGVYRAHAFRPILRLPELSSFDAARSHLRALGFASDPPTLTQIGDVDHLLASLADVGGEGVDLAARPDADWMAMFLGEGFDPVDGASRAGSLARATGTRYASVREGGQTLACGAASFGEGWLGVHGLRTATSQRGRGLAARLLWAVASEARRRGIERVYLQVHASSASALALYRRVGFETAWTYTYWRPGAGAPTVSQQGN